MKKGHLGFIITMVVIVGFVAVLFSVDNDMFSVFNIISDNGNSDGGISGDTENTRVGTKSKQVEIMNINLESFYEVTFDMDLRISIHAPFEWSDKYRDETRQSDFIIPEEYINFQNDKSMRKQVCLNYIDIPARGTVTWNNDYFGYRSMWNDNDWEHDCRFVNFNVDNNAHHCEVTGKVKNIGDDYLSRSSVKVDFYDKHGAWLADGTDSDSGIASGYTWDYKVSYQGKYIAFVDHVEVSAS